jgi:signal transduction histidine kinase/CheY-like chemotaxis protein
MTPPKSVSLTAQLLITLLSLVIGTAAVLTVKAYRSSTQTLETDARRTVRVAAEKVNENLERHLHLQEQQAEGFLTSVESLCGERAPSGAVGWETACVRTALESFRATERATGALLEEAGRQIARAGSRPNRDAGVVGLPPRLLPRDGGFDYVFGIAHRQSVLTLQFSGDAVRPFFEDRSSLGESGEIFLINADDRFLTPTRYGTPQGAARASAAEPITACLNGPAERIDLDYRGVRTFHGVRPVSAFQGGACVDAHIGYDEALAPANGLWNQLVLRAVFFVLLGVLLSLAASHWIAAPVRRLALSARALQAGEFDRPIPAAGPTEVRALAHDLTDMANSLAELVAREHAARRDAEAANRTKDDFLAMVSHELRTPLTAIVGWAWLLRWKRLGRKESELALEAIERSANTQSRLVEDLLDISRIVADKIPLNLAPVSLVEPVESALDAVRLDAEMSGVTIEADLDRSLPPVMGDSQRLQQIVANLLTNAVKFTPVNGRVSVRARRVDSTAELSVSDTGAGIPSEFLPFVFDRFRQGDSKARRSQAGLGLGLAIVRHLVEQHGGTVQAASDGPARGATFTVSLPLIEAPAETAPSLWTPPRTADRDVSVRRLDQIRVLIVDDDPTTLDVIRAMLEDAGARVEIASSAAEARSTLSHWMPAVLVSDIAMPEENGYSLVRSLRTSNAIVPAIALTAYGRPTDAEQARAAGFQVYLPKPVQRSDLVDAVAALARPERTH